MSFSRGQGVDPFVNTPLPSAPLQRSSSNGDIEIRYSVQVPADFLMQVPRMVFESPVGFAPAALGAVDGMAKADAIAAASASSFFFCSSGLGFEHPRRVTRATDEATTSEIFMFY